MINKPAKEPSREELDSLFRNLMKELTGIGIGFDGAPILLKSTLELAINNVAAHRQRAQEFNKAKEHELINNISDLLNKYHGITEEEY